MPNRRKDSQQSLPNHRSVPLAHYRVGAGCYSLELGFDVSPIREDSTMRNSLFPTIASALDRARPARAGRRAGHGRSATRQRELRDLMQRGGAAPLRSRHALPALVLVPPIPGDFRGGAEGRPVLRHCLLGHCARPVGQPAQSAAGREQRARAGGDPEGARRSAPRPSASATTSTRWRCSTPTMTRRPIARA